jgi:hypothetical protein
VVYPVGAEYDAEIGQVQRMDQKALATVYRCVRYRKRLGQQLFSPDYYMEFDGRRAGYDPHVAVCPKLWDGNRRIVSENRARNSGIDEVPDGAWDEEVGGSRVNEHWNVS